MKPVPYEEVGERAFVLTPNSVLDDPLIPKRIERLELRTALVDASSSATRIVSSVITARYLGETRDTWGKEGATRVVIPLDAKNRPLSPFPLFSDDPSAPLALTLVTGASSLVLAVLAEDVVEPDDATRHVQAVVAMAGRLRGAAKLLSLLLLDVLVYDPSSRKHVSLLDLDLLEEADY